MLNALTTQVTVNGQTKKFWISGPTILQLANWAIEDSPAPTSQRFGDGTKEMPWQMTGELASWLNLAKKLSENTYTQSERYFWICGRFIKKFSGKQAFYMADAGGGLKMHQYAPPKQVDSIWTRTGNNPKNSSVGVEFERGGPSYRNIGNRLQALKGDSNDVVWSQSTARQLRDVLLGKDAVASIIQTHGHMTLGQTLPTIAAAMFLGESGRNLRAFLTGKMLLDMMEAGVTYGGRKEGSSPKQYTMKATFFRESKTGRDPGDKGGKLPAAMTGSGEAGRKPIEPDPSIFASWRYTQAKELTIICRAIHGLTFTGTDESSFSKTEFTQLTTPAKVPDFKSLNFSSNQQVLGYLKYLMGTYLHSFKL